LSSIAERVYFQSLEWRTSVDLAHPTYYYLLSRRRLANYRCPAVITVHDMISEIYPPGTRAGEIETEKKRRAVADAARVICVSENTKRDLMGIFGTPEEKIRVIYEASELEVSMAGGDEPQTRRSYFLYVGGHEALYKNFSRFLRSFARVVSSHPDVALCVAGPPLTNAELATIESLNLSRNIVQASAITDSRLATLYHHSIALVYPSLYEGFGIPPLEAMACETAVIASNRSSIPEVVGDAGLLVDPECEEELAAAMISMIENRDLRQEFICRGRDRRRHFSWDKMAAEIYDIYRDVIQ
jgi:glycosyltransferase involved in cell wall biosynthesis